MFPAAGVFARPPRGDRPVKISQEQPAGQNAVTGYGQGWIEVTRSRHRASLGHHADLAGARYHLAAIVEMRPEIVFLGSGAAFRFPEPALLAPLYRAGIGVEVMDTPAACRTYNILMGEGRNVVAALIVE